MGLFGRKSEKGRTIDEIINSEMIDETLPEEADDSDEISTEENPNKEENDIYIVDNKLEYFGMGKEKTEKWLMKLVSVWYILASLCWFVAGALTFAPILFIAEKVDVLFKNKKKSIIIGVIVYALIIGMILFFTKM